MKWGCCGDHQRLSDTADAGFDYAEAPTRMLVPSKSDLPSDVQEAYASSPIVAEAFNVFVPKEIPVVGPNVDEDAVRSHVTVSAERAVSLGARVIVFGSGGARTIPEGFSRADADEQVLTFLQLVADVFDPHGLTLVIEPLPARSCNYIHTVSEAAVFARKIDRPQIRVLTDLSHAHASDDPLGALADVADLLSHVHVPVPDTPECAIDGSEVSHLELFRTLRSIGYDRRISIEDHGSRFTDFLAQAAPVLRRLKSLWEEAA